MLGSFLVGREIEGDGVKKREVHIFDWDFEIMYERLLVSLK